MHTVTFPNGKNHKLTHHSIIAFAWFKRPFVEEYFQGKTCEKKQRQQYIKRFGVFSVMENKTDQSQYKRKHIIGVSCFVVQHITRQIILRTQTDFIQKFNPCNPVTVSGIIITLNIVLSSGKIPQQITHIHITKLIIEHKLHIICKRRNFYIDVVTHLREIVIIFSQRILVGLYTTFYMTFHLHQLRFQLLKIFTSQLLSVFPLKNRQ